MEHSKPLVSLAKHRRPRALRRRAGGLVLHHARRGAARRTPTMRSATVWVESATCEVLRAISRVALPCSSTDAAMAVSLPDRVDPDVGPLAVPAGSLANSGVSVISQ